MRVTSQQRLGEVLIKGTEGGNGFRSAAALQVRSGEIIRDVIADVSGVGLSAAEGIDGFGGIAIDKMRVSDGQPRERAGVFSAVFARKHFDTGVRLRSAVLEKLSRHRFECG
jgi:hypothetical protein